MKHLPIIAAILPWPILAGLLKHFAMDGVGPIWPGMLFSCLVAAMWNPRAAAVLAVGVGAAQITETTFAQPVLMQVGIYSLLAFAAVLFLDKVAATAAALVSLLYWAVFFGIMPWFGAVVVTEFVIIFGLIGAAINGPTGGIYWRAGNAAQRDSSLVRLRRSVRSESGATVGRTASGAGRSAAGHPKVRK